MRLFFILSMFFLNNLYSQSSIKIYDSVISKIKNSKELLDFSISHNVDKVKFAVSESMYSFCGDYVVFQQKSLNRNIMNKCLNSDLLSEEILKEPYLKTKSDKGRKTAILYLSKMLDNHIISEVVFKKAKQESLFFLFKINGDNLEIIESNRIYKN